MRSGGASTPARRPVRMPSRSALPTSPNAAADLERLLNEVPEELQRIALQQTSGEIHDTSRGFSILNIMHALYSYSGKLGNDIQAEGFKSSVILWSGAYYVAYALMMTIAFAMLVETPEPRVNPPDKPWAYMLIHFRPQSDVADAVMQLLYVFFAACACYDSTWGMMLCAEWGVRAPAVPPALYERFMSLIDPNGPNKSSLSACERHGPASHAARPTRRDAPPPRPSTLSAMHASLPTRRVCALLRDALGAQGDACHRDLL